MRELSLFSGAGGGLLGTHLLGWQPIGYVEFDDYCQRIIKARIKDGILQEAPIFGDLRAFISEGYAESYKGMVDVITAGFPCQPFSVAGKQAGADDPRNVWPSTIQCIRLVRPRFVFLENVSGLLTSGYFGRILGDLAESGYDCKWRILSAAEMGAPHKRDRLWIKAELVNSNCYGFCKYTKSKKKECIGGAKTASMSRGQDLSVNRGIKGGRSKLCVESVYESSGGGQELANSPPIYAQGQSQGQGKREFGRGGWWSIEPDVGRVANGVAA
ncbi:DNA cytosine methyltransferase, partial [bacterium]|nr:DNA cytosine methyltransferase [bacterium]